MIVVAGMKSHVRTRWPEWALALILLGQSLLIAAGTSLTKNPLYVVLHNMVDMHVLARIAVVIAAVWLLALFLNGTYVRFRRISPWVRVTTAALAASYWVVYAVTLWQGANYTSVAWYNNAALAFLAAMCVFMAAGEVAHADQKAEQWHRIRRKIGGQ